MPSPLVARITGLSKHFGATRALERVDFDVAAGEVHALVGENGAGKSTLVRILSGVHRPDAGIMEINGRERHFSSPHDAILAAIVTIPQELRLVPALSVAENLTLGAAPVRRVLGLTTVDRNRMRDEAAAQLAALDFHPDVDMRVDRLSFAERQLVAIAKALRQNCSLLILDEPTAALETREIERLFTVLERMRTYGRGIIYVSHRLDEVVRLADRCTVLRDGRVAAQWPRGGFGIGEMVRAMSGRSEGEFEISTLVPGPERLADAGPRDDAIAARAREIVGLAGLLGSGTDRVLRRLFGLAGPAHVRVDGAAARIGSPAAAIRSGIGMVPGERRLGLVMNQSISDNILLASLDRAPGGGRFKNAANDRLVETLMELLDIRPRDPQRACRELSGGNQQKVVLAKWLAREVGVLLLDEPTQGVDVGSKAQIHAQLRRFAADGGAVLLSSSDTAEIRHVCDCVLAFRHGAVTARLERAGLDDDKLHAAIGG